jgi:hypothetical protein
MRFRKKDIQPKLIFLDEALQKLVKLNIAELKNETYQYTQHFASETSKLILSPPGRLKQLKLARESGHKLITQILALAMSKPSRKDIENMITAYVCLRLYLENNQIEVDKKIIPDLAYAVWYLNDHNPTLEEVKSWTLQTQSK